METGLAGQFRVKKIESIELAQFDGKKNRPTRENTCEP